MLNVKAFVWNIIFDVPQHSIPGSCECSSDRHTPYHTEVLAGHS